MPREREVAIKRGNRDFKGGRASRTTGREWGRRTNQCLVVGPAGIFGREGMYINVILPLPPRVNFPGIGYLVENLRQINPIWTPPN